MIIAVDFDGVLSVGEYKFPHLGEPNKTLFEILIHLKREGHKIILWTCRANEGVEAGNLDMAIDFCAKHGLTFDAINDNLEEKKEKYGVNSRKIYADKYIDDKAWNPTTDKAISLYNELKQEVEKTLPIKPVSESDPDEYDKFIKMLLTGIS
jgi:hypothetical protein